MFGAAASLFKDDLICWVTSYHLPHYINSKQLFWIISITWELFPLAGISSVGGNQKFPNQACYNLLYLFLVILHKCCVLSPKWDGSRKMYLIKLANLCNYTSWVSSYATLAFPTLVLPFFSHSQNQDTELWSLSLNLFFLALIKDFI